MVIEEQVGATASTARPDVQYVWGPQYIDDLVVLYRDADTNGAYNAPSLEEELYSLADANFNVTAVTNSSGAVQERFSYTAYGESSVLASNFSPLASTAFAWTHRYTTRELDLETGLQLNRERWYHQQLGRWTSRDPIGYEGSEWNLHEYGSSQPINATDPTGLANKGKCTWGQGEWSITTRDGITYSGETASSLYNRMKNMIVRGERASTVIVKGHGNSQAIVDDNDNEFIELVGGTMLRTAGMNATQVWITVMGGAGSVSLRGCNTGLLAKGASKILPDSSVCGAPIPVLGIPGTTCTIGPMDCYENGSQ